MTPSETHALFKNRKGDRIMVEETGVEAEKSAPCSRELATERSMEEFLQDIERRAFHMAKMATGSREDALDIVQDTMFKLVESILTRTQANGVRCFIES